MKVGIIAPSTAADQDFCARLCVFFEDQSPFSQQTSLRGAHQPACAAADDYRVKINVFC